MRNQGELYLGGAIILIGILFLIGNLTDINVAEFCWPVAIILLGVWLLARPRMLEPGIALTQKLLGSVDRHGDWVVTDEEIWTFIADMDLDMTAAEITPGETQIRAFGFIGDIELSVPADVGVSIASTAFVSEVKLGSNKEERFIAPLRLETDGYKTAERKIRLESTFFVGEVKVRQV
jgi:lia operon protein LiaF